MLTNLPKFGIITTSNWRKRMVCEQYFYNRATDKDYTEIKALSGENYRIADVCASSWATSAPAVFALGTFVGFFSGLTVDANLLTYSLAMGASAIAASGVLNTAIASRKLHANKKKIFAILKKRPDLIQKCQKEMLV